jgi:hypothetical protein
MLSSGELNPGLPRAVNCLTSGNTDHYTTEEENRFDCFDDNTSVYVQYIHIKITQASKSRGYIGIAM